MLSILTRSPNADYFHNSLMMSIVTPCSRVLEKLTGYQLVKKFPLFYGTPRFITVFTTTRHLPISSARSIQSMPSHPTSWRFILILYPIYALVSPVISFPQVSIPKPCIHLSSPPYVLHAPPISFFSIWSPKQYLWTLSNASANYLYSAGSAFGSRPEQRFSWHVFHYFLHFQAN